jgi:hypothetical protein
VIYEIREYVALEGAAERLHERFAQHTLGLFRDHGIHVVGFWHEKGDPGRILYLVSARDQDSLDAAWDAFKADPRWQEVKQRTEQAGELIAEITSRVLIPVPYFRRDD